jgi:hypothetical protein
LHTDTNYLLLRLALSGIKQNLGASPVVIFAGDLLVHKISSLYYESCDGLTAGQTPTAQQVLAMQAFADKTAAFVMQQTRTAVGSVPVMFVVGNNDSYTGLGPDSIYLANTVEPYYAKFVNGTAADYPAFFNTFTNGGYYSAQPLGSNLKIISLNTNLFAALPPTIPSNEGAAYAELAWFDTTLAAAQTAGQKVWLLMHVPPGADTCTSAANLAADGSLTSSNAAMMWMPAYQESFLQILAKYPGVITLSLGGHTHRDEFRVMTAENVLDISPSISPYLGNNPAFEIYSFTQATLTPTDYQSLNYDLALRRRSSILITLFRRHTRCKVPWTLLWNGCIHSWARLAQSRHFTWGSTTLATTSRRGIRSHRRTGRCSRAALAKWTRQNSSSA